MSDLRKLIEAVEDSWWYGDTTDILGFNNHMQAYRAFNGDLNAAAALHEALLPGWIGLTDTTGFARVWRDEHEVTDTYDALIPEQPARAWLLAILRAVEAKVGVV